ncbi:hypothetical protein ACFY4C_42225 [Actinomadura viridis]|uniref:hypothetical protein n=1 Tax=Actinomadura viridis TaxID=58110 RepID=UPI0036C7C80D
MDNDTMTTVTLVVYGETSYFPFGVALHMLKRHGYDGELDRNPTLVHHRQKMEEHKYEHDVFTCDCGYGESIMFTVWFGPRPAHWRSNSSALEIKDIVETQISSDDAARLRAALTSYAKKEVANAAKKVRKAQQRLEEEIAVYISQGLARDEVISEPLR